MRRWSVVVGLVAVVGLGATACARPDGSAVDSAAQTAVEVAAAMGEEGQALAALGFSPDDISPLEAAAVRESAPSPSPSAGSAEGSGVREGERAKNGDRDRLRHRAKARVLLRRNTLHGEVVVQTKNGTKTVAVQRGEITAIDGDSVTVKSSDGFTQTWTFGEKLNVVERRTTVQPDQLEVGDAIGVAGAKDGDTVTARLIVIPRAK